MDLTRVYLLASDHRWQWEEWCDAAGVPRPRISEVKRLVYDAFVAARRGSSDVERHGALLLDSLYAADIASTARASGIPVGVPVEKAGVVPLRWQDDPFHAAARSADFAKVLIRYRPEWPEADKTGQIDKLLELQSWCGRNAVPLLVEILIPRQDEDEREFEVRGRPALLAAVIRDAYRRGLVPQFWKIEATDNREAAAIVDAVIRERPEPRQLILGKGADPRLIARWFDAAGSLPSMAGFAIGRSILWDPGTAYLSGRCSAGEAAATIAERYLALVDDWNRRVLAGT